MAQRWLEFKYSFLGNFSKFIESLSEIEKAGLITKSLVQSPMRVYEHEMWRIVISSDRIDFYPKRAAGDTPNPNEFVAARSLFSDYIKLETKRIAINSTILFDEAEPEGILYTFGSIKITQKEPNEFLFRINSQTKSGELTINNIITISKGPFVINGNPQIGVFASLDINTAPDSHDKVATADFPALAADMIEQFISLRESYVQIE